MVAGCGSRGVGRAGVLVAGVRWPVARRCAAGAGPRGTGCGGVGRGCRTAGCRVAECRAARTPDHRVPGRGMPGRGMPGRGMPGRGMPGRDAGSRCREPQSEPRLGCGKLGSSCFLLLSDPSQLRPGEDLRWSGDRNYHSHCSSGPGAGTGGPGATPGRRGAGLRGRQATWSWRGGAARVMGGSTRGRTRAGGSSVIGWGRVATGRYRDRLEAE
jgi:hypothetical protein